MDPLANLQSGTTDSTKPEEPIIPSAPIVPDAPVIPEAEDGKLNETEQAEADEWDSAADEVFPGLKKVGDEKKDESDESKEKPTEGQTDEAGEKGNESPEAKGEAGEKGGEQEEVENESAAPTDAAARLSAREEAAIVENVKTDIREKIFGDVPTAWRDKDGEVIDTVDKVMQYVNQATGEGYTREEATLALAQAEKQIEKGVAEMERQVAEIADTTFNIKDQADVINYNYGELLNAMPDLRASLWAEYEKTLTKDPKSGLITKAPVSLQSFYTAALEPYAQMGRQLESREVAAVENTAKAEAESKAAAEAKKQAARQDRSDIYGKGKTDTATEEDKEWDAAIKTVYGQI